MDITIIPNVIILLFSIIVHEVAHGWVALKLGDPTASRSGRLTMNPIPHIDLFGSIIIPAFLIFTGSPILFGWAKPVPINPWFFRDRMKGVMLTSLAGPISNLLMAITSAFLLKYALPILPAFQRPIAYIFLFSTSINLILAIFNLIPIPPLDGSKVLAYFLPDEVARAYLSIERFGFLILIFLLYAGLINSVVVPIYHLLVRLLLG